MARRTDRRRAGACATMSFRCAAPAGSDWHRRLSSGSGPKASTGSTAYLATLHDRGEPKCPTSHSTTPPTSPSMITTPQLRCAARAGLEVLSPSPSTSPAGGDRSRIAPVTTDRQASSSGPAANGATSASAPTAARRSFSTARMSDIEAPERSSSTRFGVEGQFVRRRRLPTKPTLSRNAADAHSTASCR